MSVWGPWPKSPSTYPCRQTDVEPPTADLLSSETTLTEFLESVANADNVSLDASSSNATAANVTHPGGELMQGVNYGATHIPCAGAKAAEPATDAPGELLTNSTKADVGNRSNTTLRGMLHGDVEAAPMQSMAWLLVWICCCSFCCYSASHQDEARQIPVFTGSAGSCLR
ncbi:unnamed protein product [Symbiodinium sp. CCMP2592]|nr:unnamed protein product [Symbiodinium sp. CCMP2592]